jgi:hypothetical protein
MENVLVYRGNHHDAHDCLTGSEKPPPLDLSHHFSEVTKRRTASKIKQAYKFFQIPGILNVAGGSCPYLTGSHLSSHLNLAAIPLMLTRYTSSRSSKCFFLPV